MALATRCPDCQAMFRVVSDQLKLRGGLVRCGNCRHVFDAIGSLSYIEEAVLAAAPAPAAAAPAPVVSSGPTSSPVPAPTPAPPPAPAPAPIAPSPPAPQRPRLPEAVAALTPPPSVSGDGGSVPAVDPLAVPTLFMPNPAQEPESAPAETLAARTLNELPATTERPDDAVAPSEADSRESATAAETADEPAPQTQAARSTERRRRTEEEAQVHAAQSAAFLREQRPARGFSIVYGGGSLLLALALMLQAAVLFRTELLMRWPELRPRLVTLCAYYGCTVGWPTRADLLAVIGTELQAVAGTDILELTAVVRNRAPFRVALPAVEVTLTDTTNRTLARKVFAPVDYLASSGEPSNRINEGLGPGSDYVVRITFEARGLNASGFVVYPFYQ